MLNNSVSPTNTTLNRSTSSAQGNSVGRLSNYALNTPLKSLSEGQIIKGEITDLRNNEVTVTLEDNTRVTGFVTDGSKLSIGETAAFQVTEISPGKISLNVLENSLLSSENITVLRALEEAGFPKNEKNRSIVQELLLNQMPINKQSISVILQQSYANKDIRISTLVLMNKHHIPITKENAVQFEHYRNYEHRLIQEINTVAKELPELLDSIPSNQVVKIGSELLSLFLTAPENTKIPLEPLAIFSTPNEQQELINILKDFSLPENLETKIQDGTATLKEINQAIKQSMELSSDLDNEHLIQAKEIYLAEHPELKDMDVVNIPKEVFLEVPKTIDSFDHPVISKLIEQFSDAQKENKELGGFLLPDQLQELSKQFSSFPLHPIMQEKIANGTATLKEILMVTKNIIPLAKESSVQELFISKDFQKILKETILSSWTLTPKTLKTPDAVNDLYSRMEQQLTQLKELLSHTPGKEINNLSAQTQGMKDNIDFMKTLNEMFTYVQLPLKLKEHTIHSDLYVYTKKKDLKKNNSNITVLLHLDMEYLGPLDIHLSLSGNNVISKFYLEDKKTQKLIASYIDELEKALNKKGYSIYSEILTRQKEIDIVKDFIETDRPNSSVKRFTFDIRA